MNSAAMVNAIIAARVPLRPADPLFALRPERLRVAWTLCTISFATMKSVPLPGDLRAGMQRCLAV
ncbi:MAG TPA: hypothetical protein VFO02_03910 [Burkholderiales bacterium]|nr:hypothetical protein [Burkholderiales bacterium]